MAAYETFFSLLKCLDARLPKFTLCFTLTLNHVVVGGSRHRFIDTEEIGGPRII